MYATNQKFLIAEAEAFFIAEENNNQPLNGDFDPDSAVSHLQKALNETSVSDSDSIDSVYSDEEDVPPLVPLKVPPFLSTHKIWDYFYILKEELVRGLGEVKAVYKKKSISNGDLFQIFYRVRNKLNVFKSSRYVRIYYYKPGMTEISLLKLTHQFNVYESQHKHLYFKIKARFIRKQNKLERVKLMEVDEIEKSRQKLIEEFHRKLNNK